MFKDGARIISIVNQKGGVGKTTTAINLSAALSVIGKKVLIVDLDPQGNASTGFGYGAKQRENNVYELLHGQKTTKECIKKTDVPNLDIIVSHIDLAAFDSEFLNNPRRMDVLSKQIMFHTKHLYDYIFIDCPPSLSLLTLNALRASNSVIIPIQCEFFSLEGLSHLVKTIQMTKKNLNPSLFIEGILLTMVDKRNRISHFVEEDVRLNFRDLVFKTIIPRNVKLSEATSHGVPAILCYRNCFGSYAYLMLARELYEKHIRENKIREQNGNKESKKVG